MQMCFLPGMPRSLQQRCLPSLLQNFIENFLMIVGSGIYYLIVYVGVSISGAIVGQGLLLLVFLMYLVKYRKRITG